VRFSRAVTSFLDVRTPEFHNTGSIDDGGGVAGIVRASAAQYTKARVGNPHSFTLVKSQRLPWIKGDEERGAFKAVRRESLGQLGVKSKD
jgi:hypothetical protein